MEQRIEDGLSPYRVFTRNEWAARREDTPMTLTRAVTDAVPVPVIASGGAGTLDHLAAGIRDGHATAVLAASIFHFGEHNVREAKRYMAAAGLPVRLDA